MKKCSKCGERKPLVEFYADKRASDGLQSQCRACANAAYKEKYAADRAERERVRSRGRKWREKNPERSRAAALRWRKKNPDGRRLADQRWREKNPDKYREKARRANWRRKGIDPGQAAALIDAHDGKCALCGASDPRAKYGWHLDHDHATGKVRSVLCQPCNIGLGQFKDDPSTLRKAIAYLERHAGVA